ncbi:MAG: lipopolysaccharide/colanic/teichoic acid biosynthesis glycosyltransferase [Hyphomicrobiaceae bacterium]|jgi:lipopolysaccharide/colanic/teichoic acid biosynthesis glycosyltransferase
MSRRGETAKRAFDATVAGIALFVLWPFFAVIALLVTADSRGPIFFRQERAGRAGTTFRIYKFRTMIVGAYRSGARLTVKRDPRITRVGGVLRWTKLDELPQLINVLVGDMAFVGPRPEDPYFTNFYAGDHKSVLDVKPGIIGPSQIDGRDEVEKYPEDVENIEEYYIKQILPEKLESDLRYVREATFFGDVVFLVRGALSVIFSQFKSGFFSRQRYRFLSLGADLVLIAAAYVFANLIKFDWALDAKDWQYVGRTLGWFLLIKPVVFIYYGLYQRTSRWVGRRDLAAIVKAVSVASAVVVAFTSFDTGLRSHSRAVFIIDWILLLALLAWSRFLVRAWMQRRQCRDSNDAYIKVLVAGAGHGGEAILRSLLEDPNSRFMPVGIIDHEPHRWGALIHGVRVMGGATDIAMAAGTHGVEMVLVSLADLEPVTVREISEACQRICLECRLIPALSDLISGDSPELAHKIELSGQT